MTEEKRETKLVYFQVVDADQNDISQLGKALIDLKKQLEGKTRYDIEFLVGNEKVNLYDVKFMINELYKLYKKNKALKEASKQGDENGMDK